MKGLKKLLDQNRQWAAKMLEADATFFSSLAARQKPEYLWIGCSDSRVPANEILGLFPGDIFVHRNVANVVVHSDLNLLSVLQYAVDVLQVKHIIICGHYGCGGVAAACSNQAFGLIDNWLRHVQDVKAKHMTLLSDAAKEDEKKQQKLMCELNVVEQALNIAKTTVIADAWRRGQNVVVNAAVYGLSDGLVKPISFGMSKTEDVDAFYQQALEQIRSGRI
ncbi:MAG: carbonate dehydratase [Francisellaceae bacterium]